MSGSLVSQVAVRGNLVDRESAAAFHILTLNFISQYGIFIMFILGPSSFILIPGWSSPFFFFFLIFKKAFKNYFIIFSHVMYVSQSSKCVKHNCIEHDLCLHTKH